MLLTAASGQRVKHWAQNAGGQVRQFATSSDCGLEDPAVFFVLLSEEQISIKGEPLDFQLGNT